MKTIWRIICGLILSGALCLPSARAATGSGDSPVFAVNLLGCSVSGTVLDGSTGNGLAGALVQLGAYNTVSGSGGAYSFASVVVGDYTLTGSLSGYSSASYPLTISAGNSLSQLITLQPTNSVPVVTSVKSKFPDSSYYLDGALFNVSFTASVDWARHPPGTVQFIAPNNTYTVTASGPAVSQTLAMGSDFGPGGQLQVVATSGDGIQSAPLTAGFTVMPTFFPPLFTPVWEVQDEGTEFKYDCTLDTTFFNQGTTNIPGNIPVFGGKPLTLTFLPEADFEIKSDGSAQVTVHTLDFNASKELGENPPNPATLANMLNGLLQGGFNPSQLPQAMYGGIDFDFYPLLGGGWQYNASLAQWQYQDAFAGLGGQFSRQQTWPFLAGPVPLFAKAKFDVSAEITDKLNYNQTLNGNLSVDPTLRGSLGVGVSDVLSASVWLQGGANLELQWPQLPTLENASTTVSVGASLYALLWNWDYNGYSWSWTYNNSPALVHMLVLTQNGEPHPLSRDYLQYPASGLFAPQSGFKPNLFGTGGGGTNLEILLTPAMPYSDPNCSSGGTNLYLVFLEDNTNRTSMNRTIAMFSSFNGTLWSTPTALADDGTADFHPRILTFSNRMAVAAWENEKVVQPDSVSYAGMESNLEISVAWYKPATGWQTAQMLTANNYISHTPKLAGRSTNNVLLTWISNPANDAGGSSVEPNQIWSSKWNGSAWSAPQLAGTVSNTLVKYDLAYNGTNADLVMSVDMVDDSTNNDGHELFLLASTNGVWGNLTRLTSDQVPDDDPQLAFDGQGHLILTWLKGTALSSAINLNLASAQVVYTNIYSSNLADFTLANNGAGKLVMLWPEPSDNDSDLFAMFYDPIYQTWGAPRQLTDDPQTERGTTAAFYGTNELVAVYNRTMISSTNDLDTTPVDLVAIYHPLDEDLALDGSSLNANPANPALNSTATLTVEVLNLGDQVETNVAVAFYLGSVQSASKIGQIALTNAIPPQGSNVVTFAWQVPATTSPVTVFAVVDPNQTVPEINFSNNTSQITLVEPNTEIKSTTWSRVASNLLAITVTVINDGVISNTPTTVSLNENSVTGPNLFNQTIATLAPGQSREVTFLWNTTGLPNSLTLYSVLSGAGISNNFSTLNTSAALNIIQVQPPRVGSAGYLTNGGFQIQLYGTVGQAYTFLASTNLINWTPVRIFTCTNSPMNVVDPVSTNYSTRFYRFSR